MSPILYLGDDLTSNMHSSPLDGFGCCPFGSVVVYSLFIVVPIVCGGFVFGPCFVIQYLVSFCSHLAEEERAGCFTSIVFLLSYGFRFCVSSSQCL